jgi:hypothetical protein
LTRSPFAPAGFTAPVRRQEGKLLSCVDILFVGTLFVDIRFGDTPSAATLFADTLSEKAALTAPPSSLATIIREVAPLPRS